MPPRITEQPQSPVVIDDDPSNDNESNDEENFQLSDIPGYNVETGEIVPDIVVDWALDTAIDETAEMLRTGDLYGESGIVLDGPVRQLIQKKIETIGAEFTQVFVTQRVRTEKDIKEASEKLSRERGNEKLIDETIDELVAEGYFTDARGDFLRRMIAQQLYAQKDFNTYDAYLVKQGANAQQRIVTLEDVAARVVHFSQSYPETKNLSSNTEPTKYVSDSPALPTVDEVLVILNPYAEKYVKAVIRDQIFTRTIFNLYEHRKQLAHLEALDEAALFHMLSQAEGQRFQFKEQSGRFFLGGVTEWMMIMKDAKGINEESDIQIEEREVNRRFYSISVNRNKSVEVDVDPEEDNSPLWQEVIRVYFPPDMQSSEVKTGIGSLFHYEVLFDDSEEVLEILNSSDSVGIQAILKNFGIERSEEESPTPSPSH